MPTTDITAHGTLAAPITIQPVSGFWKGYEPESWWYSPTLKFDPRLSIAERIFKVWGAQAGAPGVPNLPNTHYMNRGETVGSLPGTPTTPWFAPPPQQPILPPTFPNIKMYTGGMIPVLAPEAPMLQPTLTYVPPPSGVPVSVLPPPRTLSYGGVAPQEDWKGALIGAVTGLITGGPGGAVLGGIAGYGATGGGETPTSPGVPPTGFGPTACPTGYRWDGARCVAEGIGGAFERFIPGGKTGALPTNGVGTAGTTMGAFGIPASMPSQVGQTQYGPILRCMAGSVLGKDNLCYPKGSIPNKHRKWPRGSRPLLTGGDMKTLRKIGSLQGRVKRAWASAGKPGNRPAPKPCTKHHHHK